MDSQSVNGIAFALVFAIAPREPICETKVVGWANLFIRSAVAKPLVGSALRDEFAAERRGYFWAWLPEAC